MSSNFTKSNTPYDQEIIDITDYVLNYEIKSPLAYETAWHCFIDTIGCGLEALEYEACMALTQDCFGFSCRNNCKKCSATPSALLYWYHFSHFGKKIGVNTGADGEAAINRLAASNAL